MTFILNFHGIGECARPFEDGEAPYWISVQQFEQCLAIVEGAQSDGFAVRLSFDDGNASDHDLALPLLQKHGLGGDFFVLTGKIGQPGYLTVAQIKAIDADEKSRIGSHGMDHRPWPDLGAADLKIEIVKSKIELEATLEHPVTAAGLPFGRYNRHVLGALRKAGYNEIYSSDGGPRLRNTWPMPRFSVRNDTDMQRLPDMIRKSSALPKRLRTELRAGIKSLR